MDTIDFVKNVLERLVERFKKDQPYNPCWWKFSTNSDKTVIEARIDFSVGEPLDLLFIQTDDDIIMVFEWNSGGWKRIDEYNLNNKKEIERAVEDIY